jgi:Cu(I)/Ag(I) efflux system periplasmic protein CusF
MNLKAISLFACAITLALPGHAQTSSKDHAAHHPAAQAQSADLSEGEVRKVDKAARKITIKHGPLKNLDMPAMTMVFKAKDAAMIDQVKAGDKIRFRADKLGDDYTVTRLEPAK